MAVVEFVEDWKGRKGSWEFKGSWWVATYNRSFKIVTDNPADTFDICSYASANGLALGSFHPQDITAVLQSITPSSGADPYKWKLEVGYSNQIDPSWMTKNPLDRPIILKLGTRKEKEYLQQAWLDTLNPDGSISAILKTVLNSAGQPYDPPLERDREIPQITLTQNVSATTFNPFVTMAYRGAVNLDTYRGCPPASLRVADAGVSEQLFENLIPYYTVTWTLELCVDFLGQGGLPGGWRSTQVLDRGLYENVPYVRANRAEWERAFQELEQLEARRRVLVATANAAEQKAFPGDEHDAPDAFLRHGDPLLVPALPAFLRAGDPLVIAWQEAVAAVERIDERIVEQQIYVDSLTRDERIREVPVGEAIPQGAKMELRQIRDPLGRPATQPLPLNGQGRRLPNGQLPAYQYWNLYGDKLMVFTGVLP